MPLYAGTFVRAASVLDFKCFQTAYLHLYISPGFPVHPIVWLLAAIAINAPGDHNIRGCRGALDTQFGAYFTESQVRERRVAAGHGGTKNPSIRIPASAKAHKELARFGSLQALGQEAGLWEAPYMGLRLWE